MGNFNNNKVHFINRKKAESAKELLRNLLNTAQELLQVYGVANSNVKIKCKEKNKTKFRQNIYVKRI